MKGATQVIAGLLIVAGLLLVGFSTGAFDQVDADRGVSVDVSEQETAYLSLQNNYSDETISRCVIFCSNEPRSVVRMENRFVTSFDAIELQVIEVEGVNDPSVLEVTNAPGDLRTGQSADFSLYCSSPSFFPATLRSNRDVTIQANASGKSVVINTTAVVDDVDFRCRT